MTLRQKRINRHKWLRESKPIFRRVDATIEAAEREIRRLLSRKTKPIELVDVTRLKGQIAQIKSELNAASTYINKGWPRED